MPVYKYKALDQTGKNIKGLIDAESESRARSKLRATGRFPVSLEQSRTVARTSGKKQLNTNFLDRVRSEDIHLITRQLATLLDAGIPLVQALSSLVDQVSKPALKQVLDQIREAVNEGSTLTKALAEHPRLFSPVYVNMVRSGEASGSLAVVLERLADFGEKQEILKGRLKAALVYPIFMAVIGTAILLVLVTYIVPNITQIFAEMEQALPAPTLLLIAVSDFLKVFWWLVLLAGALVVFALRSLIRRPEGRRAWDLLKLRMPVVGSVNQKIQLARFATTLGSLLRSDVGLMASMDIVKTLVNNVQIAAVIEQAMAHIEKGQSMTLALTASPWFPPMFVQMIAIGEQSGNLVTMLEKAGAAYERDVETAIMAMTSLIEPVMIAALGATVFFIVLSILLPIFEMNQLVG